MIRPNHPVVLTMAEEIGAERHAVLVDAARALGVGCVPWDRSTDRPYVILANALLLTDLTRPATRDAWTRRIRNARLRAAQESGEAFADPGEVPAIFRDTDRLRDDPEALEAAVSAALETM